MGVLFGSEVDVNQLRGGSHRWVSCLEVFLCPHFSNVGPFFPVYFL